MAFSTGPSCGVQVIAYSARIIFNKKSRLEIACLNIS
jgi:hypothetical protein